jgi:hypothetical protein
MFPFLHTRSAVGLKNEVKSSLQFKRSTALSEPFFDKLFISTPIKFSLRHTIMCNTTKCCINYKERISFLFK